MQKINYKEIIELDSKINELLLINIDERLVQNRDSDCLKISGEIKVSGEVLCDDDKKQFNHPIGVDIMLSKEQLMENNVTISIDDFNYVIENNSIAIEIIMKIEGLKEIEAYFPTQENQEDTKIDNLRKEDIKILEEIIPQENTTNKNNIEEIEETPKIKIIQPLIEDDRYNKEEFVYIEETKEEHGEKYSLLNSIFKKRGIKKETCFFIHVIKEETTYEQISDIYKIEVNKIKSVNKDEKLYKGKLIFIPKQ